MMSERGYPHIEIGVVDRGVRGGMVSSEGDRGSSIRVGLSRGERSGDRRCHAGGWGGHCCGGRRAVLVAEIRNLNSVAFGRSLDSCVVSLVLLLQRPKVRLVLLKAALQGYVGRFGGGEGHV